MSSTIGKRRQFGSPLRRREQAARLRRGLAPLEFVLWAPILLMVMALMVIFGNASVWKLRTAFVARHTAWESRPERIGANDPAPLNWNADVVNHESQQGERIAQLDDPSIDQPVVRGPMLDNVRVERDLLDPTQGVIDGRAEMTQHYPMLGKMGQYDFEVSSPLLTGQFRYWEMGIPATIFRRIPFIYELPKAEAGLSQAFADAAQRILSASFSSDLDPLDKDQDIYECLGRYVDFHPRLQSFCQLDAEWVGANRVGDVVDRIQGRRPPSGVRSVAETMARFFADMYQQKLDQLQNQPQLQSKFEALIQAYRKFEAEAKAKRPPTRMP